MAICVTRVVGVHRLAGDAGLVDIGNRWLAHLEARRFSPATVRGYAYDLVCLARFLDDVGIGWGEVVPSDVFDWLEWQARPRPKRDRVVRLGEGRGAAPPTMNRRVAAARGMFEYAVMCGGGGGEPGAGAATINRAAGMTAWLVGPCSTSSARGAWPAVRQRYGKRFVLRNISDKFQCA